MVSFSGAGSILPVLSLPLVRVRAGGKVEVALLGPEVACFATHFFGRIIPCPVAECPACQYQIPRVYTYRAVALDCLRAFPIRPALLEVTSTTESRLLAQLASAELSIARGLVLSLSRRYTKSPLAIDVLEKPMASVVLPKVDLLRLMQAIAVLFCLPAPQSAEDWEPWTDRCRPILRSQLSQAMKIADA